MTEEKCCCGHCALIWLSGFFAMPVIVHLVRIIAGWPLIVAEHNVTNKETIIIIVVSAIFSIVLGLIACFTAKKSGGGVCS